MATSEDQAVDAGRDLRGVGRLGARHLALALVVMALAWLSLSVLGPGKVAPIWPANGVLLAVLLRAEQRRWAGWLLAGLAGIVGGGVANGGGLLTTTALALCDMVEVAASALVIQAFAGRSPDLARLPVVAVAGLAAVASAAVSACGAAVILGWLDRPDVIESAVVWILANSLGQMIGAPTVLALVSAPPRLERKDWLWTIVAFAVLVGVVVAVFSQSLHGILYLTYAPLLAVVFRLEVRGAALGVMTISILAVGFTVAGHGPMMLAPVEPTHRAILLQIYLLSAVLVSFPVAAVLADRRRAQQGLEAREARLRYLSDHARDVVVLLSFDPKHPETRRILDVSSSCRAFGYEPAALIGRVARDLNHPEDQAMLDAAVQRLVRESPNGPGVALEWRLRGAGGGWRWVEGHAALVREPGRSCLELVIVMRDVTESRDAAAALVASEARYRQLAENSADIVLQFDARGRILYASAAAARMGYQPQELLGRNAFEFVHPQDVETARTAMAAVLDPSTSGLRRAPEWRLLTARGDYVWVEGNPTVTWDDAGQPVAYTDSIRDISQRKALEADLARKQAEAEASEAARRAAEAEVRDRMEEVARMSRALSVGEFASSIAHEINQPIAAIVTNGEASLRWLSADPPNLDEARLAIGRTIRDADRAAAVVARTRALLSKSPPVFADVDMNACIEEVLLFTDAELRRNNIEVLKTLAAPPPEVRGDRVQLQQVLLNLIRNSIESMVGNKERPRVLSVTTIHEGDSVVVRVSDNGPGVAAAAAPRLFDSFFTTKSGGVGLGLAISRSLIEAHGGRLWASEGELGGATFQFTLPAADRP